MGPAPADQYRRKKEEHDRQTRDRAPILARVDLDKGRPELKALMADSAPCELDPGPYTIVGSKWSGHFLTNHDPASANWPR
jgi:hypothetical protein